MELLLPIVKSCILAKRKKGTYMNKIVILLSLITLVSCSAPRSIINSGKATPKGHFKVGGNMTYNFPTETMSRFADASSGIVETLVDKDSIDVDETFNTQIKALMIFSLDPFAGGTDLFVKYGVWEHFDIGYARASGTNLFSVQYQFWGSTGDYENPGDERFYGSAAVQYCSQEYALPSFLGDLQEILKYEFKRKDFLIPVIFSNSFGPEESFGAVSYGLSYGHSWVSYKFSSSTVYNYVNSKLNDIDENAQAVYELIDSETDVLDDVLHKVPQGSNHYSSFGMFTSVKFGYKHVYGIVGLSAFYQNYGKYEVFLGDDVEFTGFTFVPNLGIQFAF